MAKSIQTENVICANCGAKGYEHIAYTKDYNYKTCDNKFEFVSCGACGQVYLRNRPLVSELATIYPEENYDAYKASEKGFLTGIKEYFIKKKIKALTDNCADGDSIMEVGCGAGALLRLIKEYGDPSWQIYGVDISDKYFQDLEQAGIKTIKSRFEDIEGEDGKFSAIIMNQVIEHLESPKDVILKSQELLKPSGVLILETPSLEGWDAGLFKKHGLWEGWHAPRHWHLFDKKKLSAVVEENGMKVLRVEHILSPYLWIYSIKNWLEYHNRLQFISESLDLNNFGALSLVSSIDVLQLILRQRTSNMRLIAQKI